MNNNKKILKRSSAAFLAALNIFNFAGGSSKALNPWDIVNESTGQVDENKEKALKEFLDPLASIDFTNFETLKNGRTLLDLNVQNIKYASFYQLKDKEVLFIYFNGTKGIDKASISKAFNAENIKKLLSENFVIYQIGKGANTQRDNIEKILKQHDINFIDVDDIKNLKAFCEILEKNKGLEKQLETEKENAENAQKEAINNAVKEKKEELNKKIKELDKAKEDAEKEKNELENAKEQAAKAKEEEASKEKLGNAEILSKIIEILYDAMEKVTNAENAKKDFDVNDQKFTLIKGSEKTFLGDVKFGFSGQKSTINDLLGENNKLEAIIINPSKFDVSSFQNAVKGYIEKLATLALTYNNNLDGYFKLMNEKFELTKEKEKLTKANETAKELKKDLEEEKTNSECSVQAKILDGIIDALNGAKNVSDLEIAKGDFKVESVQYGNTKLLNEFTFKLVGNEDFLGSKDITPEGKINCKKFTINDLIRKLNKKENTIKELEAISLEDFSEQKKYQTLFQGWLWENKINRYIEILEKLRNQLDPSIELKKEKKELQRKLKEEKNEKEKLQGELDNIEKELNKLKGFTKKNKAENVQELCKDYLKLKEANEKLTKNSGSGMWKAFAVTGWLGTLLGLGYIFKEELKDAYHVAYNKVLALKNKMLNK